VRQQYGLLVYGYVVMPEHVHLLVSEPERDSLARTLQSLKQSVARRLALRAAHPFWQARYYDFNLWSEKKFVEKLRYIHRNPVQRGLVAHPEDWDWSSFRHYAAGETSLVEIESQWTARQREQVGIFPTARMRTVEETPRPSGAWTGHPQLGDASKIKTYQTWATRRRMEKRVATLRRRSPLLNRPPPARNPTQT